MKFSVLIVDDSPIMRQIQCNVVSEISQVEILEADDGLSALYRLQDRKYQVNLMLIDWDMPRMDGLTLAKLLKKNEYLRQIPILMMTYASEEGKIKKAWQIGLEGVLLKPFTKRMFLQSILSLAPGRLKEEQVSLSYACQKAKAGKSFLEELPNAIRVQIMELAQKIIMPDRTAFLLNGMNVPQFFFVLEGIVEEHPASDDTESTCMRTYGPGDCFGVSELLSGDSSTSNYIVAEKSKIACIPKVEFENLLVNWPVLPVTISQYLASMVQEDSIFEGKDQRQHGSDEALDLIGLIQGFNLRQTTGLIELPQIEASIDLLAGQVVSVHHPDCSSKDGVSAFFQILSEEPSRFRLLPHLSPEEYNVHITTPALFREAMIWLNEESKLLQNV